jgi:hypothetical protein
MKKTHLEKLIHALTGRVLTLDGPDELPLETKLGVYREGRPQGDANYPWFTWQTPKDEDNLIRSFVSCFCAKYREPNPASYYDYHGKPAFDKYAVTWNNPMTRFNSPCWNHHVSHMLTKEALREQVEARAANFTPAQAALCFYPTNYGVGIFSLFGGPWVASNLQAMAAHLTALGVPFRTELSRAQWVTRCVINAGKPVHIHLLSTYCPN